MWGFGRRKDSDHLERMLREQRPSPPRELLDEISRSIEGSRPAAPASRRPLRRVALAAAVSVVVLTVFAALGGAGLAASGVSSATSSTVHAFTGFAKPTKQPAGVVASPVGQSAPTSSGSSSNGTLSLHGGGFCSGSNRSVSSASFQYCHPRITICHNGQTLTLPIIAAIVHLIVHRDDYLGPCRN
jgi:hypothetical protein